MVNHIYNQTSGKVTVILTKPVGRIYTFSKDNVPPHLSFEDLLIKLSDLSESDFIPFIDEIESFINNGKGFVSYDESTETLMFGTIKLPLSLQRRYREMIKVGQDVTPLQLFIEKLQKNKFKDMRDELFAFMDKNDLPITEEGNFLAYKYVNSEYKDQYTGKIDNQVGATPAMDPKDVDPNRHKTCSSGLHFTSYSYAHNMCPSGGKIMILEISPETVMAIPPDYNEQKGRCYKYKVISELDVGNEVIKKDFIKKDEDLVEEIPEEKEETIDEGKLEEIPVAKIPSRNSVDFLAYDQATFKKVEWSVRDQNYTGYILLEVAADVDWKVALEAGKKKNPELSRLFELSVKMGIKPHREKTNKNRTMVAVVSQGAAGLAEVLPKAKILLPMTKTFE